MLGSQEKEPEGEPSSADKKLSGPPYRPKHDKQIEEFIKDQHRSKNVIGFDEETT